MEHFRFNLTVALLGILFTFFVGCAGESNHPVVPSGGVTGESIGELHNEFLARLYDRIDNQKSTVGQLTTAAEQQLAVDVANEMLTEHGEPTMTADEVFGAIQHGFEMAGQEPAALASNILTESELVWWERYAAEATVETAGAVYEEHVQLYGAPEPGSMLANLVDTAVHSSQFWLIRHANNEPTGAPHELVTAGWKKRVLRFTTLVVTDAVSGSLAGAGGGGIVGAAIVGGLASYGADCLLFGGC